MLNEVSTFYPVKALRKLNKKDITAYELSIRGPLFEMLDKYQHLKIEIDKNALVVETANTIRRNPKYMDLSPYIAVVMSKREILAEKIVALMFRLSPKARDLYDIYFLLENDTELKVSLVDRKMAEYGHAFTEEKFIKRMDIISKIWDKELYRLLPRKEFLSYSKAENLVMDYFKNAGLI